MKYLPLLFLLLIMFSASGQQTERTLNFPSQREKVKKLPRKDKLWIFIMAGQSNMAGRGLVEPEDTISSSRILSINKNNEWIYAKEPLHFYEPTLTGLDCGLSFGKSLLPHIDESITIALIPCAVGGSAIQQWLGDSVYRDVKLLSNFKEKVDFAKKYGVIKGILWHQGESDAHPGLIQQYEKNLSTLVDIFRTHIGNQKLPMLIGELSTYAGSPKIQAEWNSINEAIHKVAASKRNVYVVDTKGLQDKGDDLHFDSPSQREMGKRFAERFIQIK